MPAFEPATSPSDAPNSPQPASSRKGAWSVKTVSNRETATQEAAAERAFQPAIAPANEPAPSAALHSTLTAYQPASGAVYQSEPGAEDQPAPEPAPLGLRPEGPAIGGRAQATSRNPLTVIRRVAASIVRRQDAAEASSQQATPAGTDCAGNPEKP